MTKPESKYSNPIDYTSTNIIIPTMSLFNTRLDISNLLSTPDNSEKKKN